MALMSVAKLSKNIVFKHIMKEFRILPSVACSKDVTKNTEEREMVPFTSPYDHTKTYYHMDWKHGPYPRTKEERDAAAKKYNLLPEDYKPFPEDEGLGDYPDLDVVSATARDPHEPYDFQHLKRNFGEPLHFDFDFFREDWVDEERVLHTPFPKQVVIFILTWSCFLGLFYLAECFPLRDKLIPKQFPYKGCTYYTFEPADS